MCIRSSEVILESSMSYLECIITPAADISTINQVLERALKIKTSLNLNSIVCVFDQSIFAKGMEIKWKEPTKFQNCLIMLGTFHAIMMFMAVIYKRFKDVGLRDLVIQLGLLAEGSVDQALSGKMYNRGVRVYKLTYEALFSLFLDTMENFHKDDCWNSFFIEDSKTRLENLAKDVSKIKFDRLCESEEFKTFYHIFLDYVEHIKTKGGQLAQFWLSFIEMVEILHNTIYATRVGNWFLLLECYRDMMRYTFTYDHLNYAKYLPPMLAEPTELEE